jgi:hypothetical protein
MRRLLSSSLLVLCLGLGLAGLLLPVAPALGGPVDWQEVTATAAGRQWWDAGSLRLSRGGNLTVLSRFQPAAAEGEQTLASDLYVMEIDCGQRLYRDTSVNGIPRFGGEWQAAGSEALIDAVIEASCTAGQPLLQAA